MVDQGGGFPLDVQDHLEINGMKAIYFSEHGELDVIRYGDVPDPRPEAGEALLQVKACAINHLDVWVRRG